MTYIGIILFVALFVAVYKFPWWYKSQFGCNWYIFTTKKDLKAATTLWYAIGTTSPANFEAVMTAASIRWDYE